MPLYSKMYRPWFANIRRINSSPEVRQQPTPGQHSASGTEGSGLASKQQAGDWLFHRIHAFQDLGFFRRFRFLFELGIGRIHDPRVSGIAVRYVRLSLKVEAVSISLAFGKHLRPTRTSASYQKSALELVFNILGGQCRYSLGCQIPEPVSYTHLTLPTKA